MAGGDVAELAEAVAREKAARAQEELTEEFRARHALLRQHSSASWLYKRGGRAKTWKRRWCVIESGVLYYFVSPGDRQGGKAALGALVLRNAEARRPTDLSGKGKHKGGCFRLDLDPRAQAATITGAPAEEEEDHEED